MRPYIVTIVVILLLLSLFAYLVLWKTQEYEGLINIDGDMEDWDGVTRTADALGDTGNANIDLIENAFQIDAVFLSLLTTTAEPIFTSQEGHTLRVLIDSDGNARTGYALPGIGADHLIEVYGRSQTTLSSSGLTNVTVLYTFDDSRDRHDWNGFTALTWLEARTDSTGTSVEMQVPLFDLGMSRSADARLLWQTGDSMGNDDLGDNIVSLQSGNIALDSAISNARQVANSQRTGPVISIDGQFDDWTPISKQSDGSGDAGNPNVDLSEYATIQQSGLTSFYLKVEGDVLAGVAIPELESHSRPSGDLTGEPEQVSGNQQSTLLPVDTSIDAIRLFFDTDDDLFTGYQGLEVQMGADMMIEITGHLGVIGQRVIKAYTGDGDDFIWGSTTSIDAATAGSEIELEAYIPGSDSSYYIHLTSWDAGEDSAGFSQQEDKSGSRGTPSIPAWNSGDWEILGADNNDASTNAADIFNTASGSRFDNLMYNYDGSEFMYFQFFLEADPTADDVTYAILMNDGSSDSNFDFLIASYSESCARVYTWSSSFGGRWVGDAEKCDSNYFVYSTTDNQERVALAISISDSFTPVDGADFFKAVTSNTAGDMFDSSSNWKTTRNPTPGASEGDYTTPAAIPEFSTLLAPVLSVLLVVGLNYRRQRNTLASRPAQT